MDRAQALARRRAGAAPERRGAASPLPRQTLALTIAFGVAITGWMTTGLTLLGAFGAAWLPEPPPLPAGMVLDGMTVGIDPGHGGFDPGVLLNEDQPDEIRECDINLSISLKLRDILERAGATVVMSRTEDVDLAEPGDEATYGNIFRAELTKRAEVIKAADPDVFVSIHCNGFPEAKWRGSQTFYLGGDEASRLLAECIQQELVRLTRETEREANWREGLFILKQFEIPAVIVELGFLSNPRDRELLTNKDYQHLCALAVFFGICRFLRLTPTGPEY